MNKITYLFGAGASIKALPIVKDIPERLEKLIEKIDSDEFRLEKDSSYFMLKKTKYESQQCMIELMRWLLNEIKDKSKSVDEFAKALFDNEEIEKLENLKLVLSIFFTCEQVLNPFDPRYYRFLSLLINDKILSPDVRIISWNYDNQFEKAYSSYSEINNGDKIKENLNVRTKFENSICDNRFGIFKMNGSIEFYNLKQDKWHTMKKHYIHKPIGDYMSPCFNRKFIDNITKEFERAINPEIKNKLYKLSLSFAWESGREENNNIVNATINETNDTKELVIVGYSFPEVNSRYDIPIITKMINLKKIYFQNPDAENLIKKFKLFYNNDSIELIPIIQTDNFFVPTIFNHQT